MNIVLFILMGALVGYLFTNIIFKDFFNIKLYLEEYICFNISLGFFMLTIYVFVILAFGFNLSQTIFVPYIILSALGLFLLTKNFICKKYYKNLKITFDYSFENIVGIFLSLVLIFMFLNFITTAISSQPYMPDEEFMWALRPKMIFYDHNLSDMASNLGSNYPPFFALLSASYYFMFNKLDDCSIMVFSTLFTAFLVLTTNAICKRRKYNKNIMKLFFIFALATGLITTLSTTTFVDTIFMYTYTVGTLYLLEYLFYKADKTFLIISIILVTISSWLKVDGTPLCLGNGFIIFVALFYGSKEFKLQVKKIKNKISVIFVYVLPSVFLYIIWDIFCKISLPPLTEKTSANFSNLKPMLNAMFSDLTSGGIGLITLALILIGLYLIITKQINCEFISLYMLILINIAFLGLAYILVFGDSAKTASSFIRYMTRIIPIYIIIFSKFFSLNKIKLNSISPTQQNAEKMPMKKLN